MQEEIRAILFRYGGDILRSDLFRSAWDQTHHAVSNVAQHSLSVAVVSLYICLWLRRRQIRTDLRAVVVSSLCHDLGILGREKKYANEIQCCRQHPGDSVQVFRALSEEEDPLVEDAIARHMWPLTFLPPRHREGFILTLADKISSCMERMGRPPAALLGLTREELEADI